MTNLLDGSSSDAEQRREYLGSDLALINIPSVRFLFSDYVQPISFFKAGKKPNFGTDIFVMTGYGEIKPDPLRPGVETLPNLGMAMNSKYN